MTLKARLLLPFIGVAIIGSNVLAQGPVTNMELNRAPLRYYSGNELKQFEEVAPEKSEQIKYYFTESFIAHPVDCKKCPVDPDLFYNQFVFNIAEHESKRKDNEKVTFVYKEKYEVTLTSKMEVVSQLGLNPSEVLTLKIERPMPEYQNSGDDSADFILYKEQLRNWIIDFPELFRTFQANSDLLKISIEELKQCDNEKRTKIFSNQAGYLITD